MVKFEKNNLHSINHLRLAIQCLESFLLNQSFMFSDLYFICLRRLKFPGRLWTRPPAVRQALMGHCRDAPHRPFPRTRQDWTVVKGATEKKVMDSECFIPFLFILFSCIIYYNIMYRYLILDIMFLFCCISSNIQIVFFFFCLINACFGSPLFGATKKGPSGRP